MKSTVEQIRARFDHDVERFSNLETGQSATMDAPLCLELVTSAAAAVTPRARAVLDIGCGAGNYTLKMLQKIPNLDCTLMDLSQPMLDRARQRVSSATGGEVRTLQTDVRSATFAAGSFDIVLAAAVLHHLRTDEQWRQVFSSVLRWLRPGGSFWVFDYLEQSTAPVQELMRQRYGEYLYQLKGGGEVGEKYRDSVFAYIEAEDTPKPLLWQISLLVDVGFVDLEILHKNGPFAAFGGHKARQ
ncbi:MAG: class I SAM-dependent methyltransferase [Phycisphaerae bacterium]